MTAQRSEYCSHCQKIQPVSDAAAGALRCEVCGRPVEGGLLMESTEVRPPDTVLIVDDDPLITQMYRDVLEHNGFRVRAAGDGPSGLEMAAREHPTAVLLDVLMPGMDGFEVCRRIRADASLQDTRVIILTAVADPKLNLQAFKAGADLALRKPAEPALIMRTIQAALALKATKKA